MNEKIFAVAIGVLLSGCSDGTPMQVTDRHQEFVGVWQQRHEDVGENSLYIDNMLLSIGSNGTAVYRKCEVNEVKTGNSKSRSSSAANFPTAFVTQIANNKIVLVQKVGWFGLDEELTIDKAPYREGDIWYMGVEGKKLEKLDGRKARTDIYWRCPEDEDEE